MAAREGQRDVLHLRGVQNVLVLRPATTARIRQTTRRRIALLLLETTTKVCVLTNLWHDELVDDTYLAVVDDDLVSGSGRRG